MVRRLYLYLTDRRLRGALNAIGACAGALGDLAKNPEYAPAFFKPHRLRLARLAYAVPGGQGGEAAAAQGRTAVPGSGQAVPAAEDFTARLENFFNGLARHKTAADAPVRQSLSYLQAACAETWKLLSPWQRADALAKIRGLSATGTRHLRLARTAISERRGNFPQILKFSSMYSDLEAVFDALERCALSLYES